MMEAYSPTVPYTRPARRPVPLGLFGDERLARLVADGNERAFVVLFERYHQPLYRYCRSILRHDSDAQDALQSAFAGALVALRRGQRDAPLRPWLFRIAHNESISLIRSRPGAGQELRDGMEPAVVSAEKRAEERRRLALLVADLQQLGERQRSALVMRELSGLSHNEIAVALGTSVGTAKQAIFEARAALLEFAEGRAMSCEEICGMISDSRRRAIRGRRVRAHLRDCPHCAAFAAAIRARSADLHALAAPLAPFAAAGLLARLTGRGSAHAAAGGSGAGGVTSAVASKLAGAGLASKTLVAAAVMTGAAAGVTGALSHSHPAQARSSLTRATSQRQVNAVLTATKASFAVKHDGGRSVSARSAPQSVGHATGAVVAQSAVGGHARAAARAASASGPTGRQAQSRGGRSQSSSASARSHGPATPPAARSAVPRRPSTSGRTSAHAAQSPPASTAAANSGQPEANSSVAGSGSQLVGAVASATRAR